MTPTAATNTAATSGQTDPDTAPARSAAPARAATHPVTTRQRNAAPAADETSTVPATDRPARTEAAAHDQRRATSVSGAPPRTRPRARDALEAQPTERLEADIVELTRRLSVGTYELLVLVGELDHRGAWAGFGALNVTADGNHLPDGTPISEHAVTAMLPDAFVSLLLHDNGRQPIDASPRRRYPTRRRRRVLDARQSECAHPGCHATAFLQYDQAPQCRASTAATASTTPSSTSSVWASPQKRIS